MRSVRLDLDLEALLAQRVAETGEPASEVIRAALRGHLGRAPKTLSQRAGKLVGCLSDKNSRPPKRSDEFARSIERKLRDRRRF